MIQFKGVIHKTLSNICNLRPSKVFCNILPKISLLYKYRPLTKRVVPQSLKFRRIQYNFSQNNLGADKN